MADPRLEAVPHGSKLSSLMYAKSKAKSGRVVNACPFGCEARQLDQHGYCRHLVGFTDGYTESFYAPMRMGPGGRRVVQPRKVEDEELSCPGEEPIMKVVLEPVREGDLLVKITTCSRVYRNVPMPPKAEKKAKQLQSA